MPAPLDNTPVTDMEIARALRGVLDALDIVDALLLVADQRQVEAVFAACPFGGFATPQEAFADRRVDFDAWLQTVIDGTTGLDVNPPTALPVVAAMVPHQAGSDAASLRHTVARLAQLAPRTKAAAAALLTATALTACAGGGGGGFDSADAILDRLADAGLECEGWEQNKDVIGAQEDGSCEIDGDPTSITIYKTAEQRAQIREAFAALSSGFDVDGDRWTVNVPTRAMAKKVAEALGGDVQ